MTLVFYHYYHVIKIILEENICYPYQISCSNKTSRKNGPKCFVHFNQHLARKTKRRRMNFKRQYLTGFNYFNYNKYFKYFRNSLCHLCRVAFNSFNVTLQVTQM